jgi:methionyl-tRNA formyltransferase
MANAPFIFFGSSRFAEIVLQGLLDVGFVPVAVVCNPDKPVGRKGIITPPPVKVLAQKHGIPVIQETNSSALSFHLSPFSCSFGIVAAYSRIIPSSLIELFPKGIIGVHPSLLPKYRGATPIQSAILDGEAETGVTLYLIDEKVDHGKILAYSKEHIANSMGYVELEETLAKMGAELLAKTIPAYLGGKIIPQEQDHAAATFTKKLKTEDGQVDLQADDPLLVYRKIKALNPEPGTYYEEKGKRIKVKEAHLEDGKVIITQIVEEGKKPQLVQMEI